MTPEQPNARTPIVVMGVSGSGKSTIGVALAEHLAMPYADADDFHPQANIDKMSKGHPLDDNDRMPWLAAIGEWLATRTDGGVVSCSALKRKYRDQLRASCPGVEFVHLHGERSVIAQRQGERTGHFMPSSLLDSQFETLEHLAEDEAGVVVDVDQSIEKIVRAAVVALGRPAPDTAD